jgi:hypothetical protein
MYLLARASGAPVAADASRLYYGTDTHSMGLLLGAAVGAVAAGRRSVDGRTGDRPARRYVWLTDPLAVAALAALAVAVFTVREDQPGLYRGGFLAVAALAAVVAGAVPRRGSVLGRVLDAPPLRWLAVRSYAIYLWHWPIAVVTRPGADLTWPAPAVFALRVAATLLAADLTYRAVERPIRELGLRPGLVAGGRRLLRVVGGGGPVGGRLATAAGVALVLLAGTVLITGPRPTLSAGQRALASAHGGRDLPLGSPDPAPGAVVAQAASPVAHVASGIRPQLAPSAPGTLPHRQPAVAPTRSASPHPPAGLPPVSAYGDSVMLGAKPALDARFHSGRMDAVEGRQPDPILADVRRDARAGRLHPLVVIGVGDNGLITPDALRDTLAALHRVPRIVLINNRVGRPWEAPNNRTIARLAPHFRNVRLLDWHDRSAGHPGWFVDDRIHLTPDGARAYSALIVAAAR